MSIDIKDRRILAVLSKDCRRSLTHIAKMVGVSREVADYRIKKLVNTGMIKSFCAEINLDVLGYTKHVVYVELKNVQRGKEEDIFKILKNNRYISWIVTSTGKWSIIFDIHSQNTHHLSQLVKELKQELGTCLGEYEIVTLERYHYFHSKYFGEKEIIKEKKYEEATLDAVDGTILKLLRNNARIDYVTLSKKIKLTPEAISKRIKRLQKSGTIKQFYIFPDVTKLGFEHYNIQINLEQIDSGTEHKIMNYLHNHPSVSFMYKPISHCDIEFGVFVKNPGELRNVMQQLRSQYPEHIRIKDVVLFYEEIVPNFLPEGVFDELLQR